VTSDARARPQEETDAASASSAPDESPAPDTGAAGPEAATEPAT
jgi:hypothetical protein